MQYHNLSDSIIHNQSSIFTSKFWFSLYHFLGIKQKLSRIFHSQTDGQTKRQNSTIKAYLRTLINFDKDNWAKLLLMAKFAYNNIKNTSISHTFFKFNCDFHPQISYKKDVDPHSWSKSVDKLANEPKKLITICRKNLQNTQKFQNPISE